MVDFPVLPGQTALINVDLQNCFVESARDGLEVVERINQLATVCREAGILVIHARHIVRPDGSHAGVLGEIVPELQDGGSSVQALKRRHFTSAWRSTSATCCWRNRALEHSQVRISNRLSMPEA